MMTDHFQVSKLYIPQLQIKKKASLPLAQIFQILKKMSRCSTMTRSGSYIRMISIYSCRPSTP